jgi:hypothetical protein
MTLRSWQCRTRLSDRPVEGELAGEYKKDDVRQIDESEERDPQRVAWSTPISPGAGISVETYSRLSMGAQFSSGMKLPSMWTA